MHTTHLGFLNLGTGEIILILLVILLLFGAKKLPELMRSMGKSVTEFKKGMNEVQEEIEKAGTSTSPSKPAPPSEKA